ncbi:hypothetical protein K501DRAFT_334466 [Backusella circina FSU 941]|nr:hypothetical protein K501DRAFT_334466 [Backusella circina FSU 941]
MSSRFTEHFDINEPWELFGSEPNSPTASSTSCYFSSTETLNMQCQYLTDDESTAAHHKSNKDPSLIYTHSFASIFTNQSEPAEPKTVSSKLKRFLSTISTKKGVHRQNPNSS